MTRRNTDNEASPLKATSYESPCASNLKEYLIGGNECPIISRPDVGETFLVIIWKRLYILETHSYELDISTGKAPLQRY
jgi:hypothetical protein